MRLPIQSSGVSRFTCVSYRARGITPQEGGSIIGTRAQLDSALQFKLPSWLRFTKTCCGYSTFTGQVECVTREVSPFDICECFQGPPPFDFPSVVCRPPEFVVATKVGQLIG